MMGIKELTGLFEAFGASGVATILTTMLTGKLSGVKKQEQAEPTDDARAGEKHLRDEVEWLRLQLAREKAKEN